MVGISKIISLIVNPRRIQHEGFCIMTFILALGCITFFHIVVEILLIILKININRESFINISKISFISATLIAPIVEEIIFRTHLSGKSHHSWSLILMYLVFIFVFMNDNKILMIPFLLFVPILFFKLLDIRFLFIVLRKHYNLTFYLTAIIFSLIHLYIVQEDIKMKLVPSLIVTLFVFTPIAIIFGIIRKKFGLIAAMLIHSLNNLIVLSINSIIFLGYP